MMAIRQRVQRLQQECIVDRGAEFGSVFFETLLTRYFVLQRIGEKPGTTLTAIS